MENLSTEQLLEVINKAIELNLSQEFIDLLGNELQKRDSEQFLISKQGSKKEKSLFCASSNLAIFNWKAT